MAVQALKKDRKTSARRTKAAKAPKQFSFKWEGADKKGQKLKGEMTAENPAMIKAQLRKQGISPIKVNKVAQPLFGGGRSEERRVGKEC